VLYFMDLEEYMRSLNPKPDEQHILIYGSKYKLWLEGRYIGIWTWTKDENVGDSFQRKNKQGEIEVAVPDRWELIPTKMV
jgi:hypothetical protein